MSAPPFSQIFSKGNLFVADGANLNVFGIDVPWLRIQLNGNSGQVELSWAGEATFKLQQSRELGSQAQWETVSAVPQQLENNYSVRLPKTSDNTFFRLSQP